MFITILVLIVLFVGVRIGVGVGSTTPTNSLVGNIGRDFSDIDITNYSKNGVRASDLFRHIKKQDLGRYDVIVVIVGGMDVIKMTSLDKLKSTLQQFVLFLAQHTKKIVLIPPNNTGSLPLYHFPLTQILNARVLKVQNIFKEVAKVNSCTLIDESISDLLADKKRYFSGDRSHPNDQGYALWYSKMGKYLVGLI